MTVLPAWDEIPSDRERDALVAEHVMGWRWYQAVCGDCRGLDDPRNRHSDSPEAAPDARPCSDYARWVPHYWMDPAADYEVLDYVRKAWYDKPIFKAFVATLSPAWWFYTPGDYAQAAYEVVRATKQGEGARC